MLVQSPDFETLEDVLTVLTMIIHGNRNKGSNRDVVKDVLNDEVIKSLSSFLDSDRLRSKKNQQLTVM